MTKVSFIPLDAFVIMPEILEHVMNKYPEYLSLENYFKEKNMITEKLKWIELNNQ